MSIQPGARIGPYEILAPLGKGGMGEVFRARDTALNRDVAIKVLPAGLAADPDNLARFRREAEALAALNHPNIAQIHGLEKSGDTPAIVMELVEGPTLADRIATGAIPVDETLLVARQIADALEAAHGRGIIHRDLKPANIKVREDGTVKVLDFGLAKAMEAPGEDSAGMANSPTLTARATQLGMVLGTAAYMAPEQAKGRRIDQRADVWAFGVVMYEMLTGQRLFRGEDVSDILAEVLKTDPDWRALPPSTPSSVRRLLRRCLTRDPSKRLRDMHDARLDLNETSEESDEAPAGATGRTGAGLSPARLALLVLAIVSGVVAGAAATSWLRTPVESVPDLRFALTPRSGGNVLSLGLSPDGRRIVYQVANQPGLQVRSLDAFDERPIVGTDGASSSFFFSPHGEWLAFYQAGKLKRLRLSGGDPLVICDVPESSPGGHWGPDGTILFSPTWAGAGLWRVDADGGTPVQVTSPDLARGETGHFFPWILPDGKAALFTVFGGRGLSDSKIAVLDLASGDIDILFEGARPQYLSSGHVLFYRQGEYQLVPFDASSRRATGEPVPVLPEARRLNPVGSNDNYVSVSSSGVLAYIPGRSTLDAPASRLVWIDRDGGVEPLPFEANHLEFSLSPDGRRVAATRVTGGEQQVWVYDLGRGTAQQLTRTGQNFGPSWYPDGRTLAVTSQTAGSFDVVRIPADGSTPAEPLRVTGADEGYWQWVSDGSSAAFIEWTSAGVEIRVTSADDLAAAETVVPAGSRPYFSISPDRRWIAYSSAGELFVSPYPSPTGRELIMTDATDPLWSPTSRELFFVHDGALKAVSYAERNGSFDIGALTTLFEVPRHLTGNWFDVSPDGRRFLFRQLVDEAAAAPAVRVAVNGIAER